LAFVLHDLFAVPFEQIAPIVDRTPAAARQLASRARKRVQGQAPTPDPDVALQREVVNAFFAAARDGDFDALLAVLDPEVVLRADGGAHRGRRSVVLHSAADVASNAVLATKFADFARPALVNGTAGAVVVVAGKVFSVMAFTVRHGRIAAIEVLYDPERVADLDVTFLEA
jgi:ketosteroid isomerase-like protein